MWSRIKPIVSNLRVFGCGDAMVHLPKEKTKKWDPKAMVIFIGYCSNTK